MVKTKLAKYTLDKMKSSLFLQKNAERIISSEKDSLEFSQYVCDLVFKKNNFNPKSFNDSLDKLFSFSFDFVKLQTELEEKETYKLKSFKEAYNNVYSNPKIMDGQYLDGLLLSQAFWKNHRTIFKLFIDNFCANNPSSGNVLEAALGTGFYVLEFLKRNENWSATGVDISKSSCRYAHHMAEIYNLEDKLIIENKNIFDFYSPFRFDRIICVELLEHLENPEELLKKLRSLLKINGKLFLTTAVWAANIDHLYLFKSAKEARDMVSKYFTIEKEIVLNVYENAKPDEKKTPINQAWILV